MKKKLMILGTLSVLAGVAAWSSLERKAPGSAAPLEAGMVPRESISSASALRAMPEEEILEMAADDWRTRFAADAGRSSIAPDFQDEIVALAEELQELRREDQGSALEVRIFAETIATLLLEGSDSFDPEDGPGLMWQED